MLGTAKEMARPHFGSRFHAHAQRFLYPHGRRVDSGGLANTRYYFCNYHRSCSRLQNLETQT